MTNNNSLNTLNVDEATLNAYYQNQLGDNWRQMEVNDFINGETTIGDYIDEDNNNIIIVIDGIPTAAITREQADNNLAMHECTHVNSMREFTGVRYLNLGNISTYAAAVLYYPFKVLVNNTNYQIFFFRKTNRMTNTLASHAVRKLEGPVVSSSHCQEDTELPYYETLIPDVVRDRITRYATELLHNDLIDD
jgi:hypothetical protein